MPSLLFKPGLQREAEAALALARKLIDEQSDEHGIVRLDGLTITSDKKILEPTADHCLSIFRQMGDDSETVMIACWSDEDDGPPFFVEYRNGYWRWIMRRALR